MAISAAGRVEDVCMDITGTARGICAQPLMTKGACSFARVLFVIEPIKHRACRTDVTKLGTSRDVARQDSDVLGGTRWHSEAL